ncbi:MAG: hypothetical protein ACT4QF_06320 [Sporichthyaceae bacterium]
MSGTIGTYVQSYLDFATVDGTASGGGTWVLIAGPVVVALLAAYMVWNLVAATASGLARSARFAVRLVAGPARPAPAAAALASVSTAPMPRIRIESSVRSREAVLVSSAA